VFSAALLNNGRAAWRFKKRFATRPLYLLPKRPYTENAGVWFIPED